MLVSIFAHLTATLSLFPLLSFVLIYGLFYIGSKSKQLALHWAINVTTILVLLSVFMTVQYLWDVTIHWILFLTVLIVASALSYLQYTVRGQVQLSRLIKGTIRLTFLLFIPVHVFLYIWVIIRAMVTAV